MKIRRMLAVILTLAMLVSVMPVNVIYAAATDDPVVFQKTLIPAQNGQPAKIKLEAYVEGTVSASSGGRPTDIIMVLDQSGSMDDSISVSGGQSSSKLSIMKNAVQSFSEEVAALNIANDDRYRIAIVGFASEDSNTEVLTVGKSKNQIEQNVAYSYTSVDSSSLDQDKSYYFLLNDEYTEVYYQPDEWFTEAGWYYGTWYNRTMVDVSAVTLYNRVPVGYPDYFDAFVDCTQSAVASDGAITSAVKNLDGNGATRADLGFEMAQRIIEEQSDGTYDNRDLIILFITDGVPTTSSAFNATVANTAVNYAKAMKDNGAHVYSLYIGTPTGNAESFMKAVSSNYPGATSYTSLGEQAAESYYSAAGSSAQITALLEEIKYTIATHTNLTEQSIVTDEISQYFRLPAMKDSVYDPTQITTYTVDKTADGWSDEEKAFSAATVELSGDGKTISVKGFNFPYHCVTDREKVPGSNDYGRKLVVYIPIIADEANDNFGGYLPTNDGAGIYVSSDSDTPVITADGAHCELEIKYSMVATEKWYHLDGVSERTKEFSFEDETVMGEILDSMIPKVPDGENNLGVNMTYKLWDTSETPGDKSDDVLVATLTVPAGESVDATDITNWTIESGMESVILDADGIEVKIYALGCKLESINPDEVNEKDVYALLSIGAIAPDVHIVGGEIDDGGVLEVSAAAPGNLVDNTYIEHVAASGDSAMMIFSVKEGYEFSKIRIDTNNHEGSMTSDVVYDISGGIGDDSIFTAGKYEYKATDVQHGIAVVVETRPITYTLTTSEDEGSEITEGTTYTYHSTENITVSFGVYNGYEIDTLTVNGTTYSGVEEMEAAGIVISNKTASYGSDGSTHTAAIYGSISLPRTQDNNVSVTSKKRYYKIMFEEYIRGYENDVFVYAPHETSIPVYLEHGANLPSAPHSAGSETVIDDDNYTLSDWYRNYDGNVFYNAIDVTKVKVSASDITLHAFWEKNPSVVLDETVTVEKATDADASGKTFTFEAYIHEHLAGHVTITGNGEAEMTITLTDRQYDQFVAGEIIRVREVSDVDDEWHYDSTVYNLTYNGGDYLLKNGDIGVEKASFTNIKNSYTVNYDLDGGLVGGSEILPKTVKWNDSYLYDINAIPEKTGATFTGWKYGTKEVLTSDTYAQLAKDKLLKSITLVAQYDTRTYTVKYDLDGGNIDGAVKIANKTVVYGDRNLLPTGTAVKDGYTLTGWTYGDKTVTNSNTYASLTNDHNVSSITLKANWEVDTIGGNPDPEVTPDDIPDKYQKVITYKIIGGTWDGINNADIVEVVTLKDAHGKYSAEGTATINVPDSALFQKDALHEDEGKGWASPQPPADKTVSGIHPETFTFVFHKKPDVEYPKYEPDEPTPPTEVDEYEDLENILVVPNGGIWKYEGADHVDPHKIELTENIALGNAGRENFVFAGWEKTDPTSEQKATYGSDIVKVYTAQWDNDEIGSNEDPDTPDNVSDKYQKKVIFKIVNGKWEDGTTEEKVYVVDLLTAGNKYSVDGTADISSIIPVNMTANSGYGNGEWDTTPPNAVSGQDTVTYVYTYTRKGGGGGGGGSVTKYTLTYESNGGTEYKAETYNQNTTVEIKKTPSKDGYIFEGWYEDKELTAYVEKVKMTDNITIYAKWVEDNGSAGNGYDTPDRLNGEDHFAYVVGYPDGTVRPNDNISRAEVTSIFFRLLKPDELRDENLTTENSFNDVNDGDWYNVAVSTMAKLGIVNGRAEDSFVPNAFITRAEFAAICARFDDSEFEVVDNFTDVSGHWAENDIHEAAAHGWIRGYDDGTFAPDRYITRAEAMTMINRVLNRVPENANDLLDDMITWPDNIDKSSWYYLVIQEATNSHNFEMKNHIYEKWTSLRDNADWSKYE